MLVKDGISLYKVVIDSLLQMIKEEQLEPGSKLPSEREMMKTFSVSRATIVKALSELEKDGFIKRFQGRGTFVSDETVNYDFPKLTGFSEDIKYSNGKPKSKLLEYSISKNFEESKYFSEEDRELIQIVRLRMMDDKPIGINCNFIPLKIAKIISFMPEDIENNPSISLYSQLEKSGYNLFYADQILKARRATKYESKHLNISLGAPIMSYERITRIKNERVVEFVRAAIAGNTYRYNMRLFRDSNQEKNRGNFPKIKYEE